MFPRLLLIAALVLFSACSETPTEPVKVDLFEAGRGDYAFYRIPGVVVTKKGSILAYCEARRDNRNDWSTMDVLMRRSEDGGRTWSDPYVVSRVGGPKEENPVAVAAGYGKPYGPTFNNPVAVVDRSGIVHLLFCLEYMRCFYARSDDDGVTFSEPREITAVFEQFRDEFDWRTLSVGPGHGIQLDGGRLVAGVRLADAKGRSPLRYTVVSTIYSDDGGDSWNRGEIAVRNSARTVNPNEPVVIELSDGRVMMNIRNESEDQRRLVTVSPNGATDWSEARFDPALLDSGVMASMIRLSRLPRDDRSRILFANPHSLPDAETVAEIRRERERSGKSKFALKPEQMAARRNLAIKLSYDEGETWPVNRVLEEGPSAYCDLAVLPGGEILCLYERGSDRGGSNGESLYGRVTLAKFTLEWLTEGRDSMRP